MSQRKVEAVEVECDACGKVILAREHDEIYGVSGDVIRIDTYGGTGGKFFSCTANKAHIGQAVMNALSRDPFANDDA